MVNFQRKIVKKLSKRLKEKRGFIQVLYGPRQVGKTTVSTQLLAGLDCEHIYASADGPYLGDVAWIETQWERARLKNKEGNQVVVLVLDEIQKIKGWDEVIKKNWDEDTRKGRNIKVMILGSSPILLEKGMTESLAGRFEVSHVGHWSYNEMKEAFGFTLEEYIFFGGYPGAAVFIKDEKRWKQYILESLVETTVSKDILLMVRVDKPALLRRLFELGCLFSAKELSFQKMLGQLQGAGNVTTLSHYLDLLSKVGMLAGLPKYSGLEVRKRGTSPKFQVYTNALMAAIDRLDFTAARNDPRRWGRYVESAVGAHLLNLSKGGDASLYYWRDGQIEVDYVLEKGQDVVAIEVKVTGEKRGDHKGLEAFREKYKPHKSLLVGKEGLRLEEFLSMELDDLF